MEPLLVSVGDGNCRRSVEEYRRIFPNRMIPKTRTQDEELILNTIEDEPHISTRNLSRQTVGEGIKPAEILRRLTAQFGDETLSRPRVFAWHKEFGQGREKVENEAHNRRPRTSITEDNIRAIRQLVEGDRCLTVAEISSVVGIRYGSAQAIITDQLGFRKEKTRVSDKKRNSASRQCPPPHNQSDTQKVYWISLKPTSNWPDLFPCEYHMFGPLKKAL
ncbi:hypothetical protein NQ318_013236 [Aromia moschata]|uniref:Transposase n=1 Tax=Aromia moschata TaxID=1265417 RepID=A0AAV8Y9P6_9CUCU|nr:hypothetical protein NQ318_013236 [Aromia moschata]